jgi:hypothetical protein
MSTPETGLPSTEGPTGPRTDARLQESRSDPEPSDHAREAAELVQKLTPAEQQHLAAAVVQSMDTPEQQRAAAEGVVRALPDAAMQGLAATVVQSIDTPEQQRAAAEGVVRALPNEQREQLADSVLGRPDRVTRQHLWYIVVWTMAAAIFIFGTMAFVLMYQKKAAEAPLALATTALGGVVGLVATSPGSRRED